MLQDQTYHWLNNLRTGEKRETVRWITQRDEAWIQVFPDANGCWVHDPAAPPLFLSNSFRLTPSQAASIRKEISDTARERVRRMEEPLAKILELSKTLTKNLETLLPHMRGQPQCVFSDGHKSLFMGYKVASNTAKALLRFIVGRSEALLSPNQNPEQ
jgi:hypothetical protein